VSLVYDYLFTTAVYFDLFKVWELKSTKAGIGALIPSNEIGLLNK